MSVMEKADRLGSCDAARRSFAFLSDYGFHLVEQSSNSLMYVSRFASVFVYHDPYSFQMGVRLSLLDTPLNAELSDIAEYGNAPERTAFRERTMFQTSSTDGVQHLVPEMARLVRTYGEPFLNADVIAYTAADQTRAAASSALMLDWKLRDVRTKLDIAWRQHRYDEIAALLATVRQHLTAAELKKLEYAERKLRAVSNQA